MCISNLMNAEVSEAAPPEAAAKPPTPYERIGGEGAVRRIVDRFYDLMDSDADVAPLRRMHAADLAPMRERLTDFMVGWLGGPPRYFQRSDAKCMGQAHAPFAIDAAIRDQWMSCMNRALDENQMKLFKAWGTNGVVITMPEVANALQTGIASGYINPPFVPFLFGHGSILKFYTAANVSQPLRAAMVSEDWYKKLPADRSRIIYPPEPLDAAITALRDRFAIPDGPVGPHGA